MDPLLIASQLRCPSGEMGEEVGKRLAEFNADANAWTLKLLDIQPNDHVLEIGFGPGEAIAEAARLTPEGFVAGIDFSETMLSMATERNARAIIQDRVELALGDGHDIPYPEQSFTKVVAINVLYFWEDLQKPLSEIFRVLRSGGTAAFYVTAQNSWLPGIAESGVFHDYAPDTIRNALNAAGFAQTNMHHTKIPEGDAVCILAKKS